MNGTNWKDFIDSIHEVEAYQQKVKSGYVKDRNKYTKTGKQKKGGAPFDQEPPKGRSKSSPVGFGGALEEEVEASSFATNDTLEPQIWEGEDIKPEIRKKLIKIAMDFMDGLPIEVDVKDITLTGSLANYNWSNYSDVDLHIIVDFLDVDENLALVKSFFDNARMKWNNDHDIKMKGYDVEIYVENEGESHKSSGVYSLLNDDWVKRPKKYRANIDFLAAKHKARDIEFQVNIVSNLITARKYDTALKNIERLKTKIRNMRRAGLESKMQEFSVENIAFKILRRNDTLGYLNDLKKKAYDDKMTVKEE
jgi:glycosyltransferase involved in cell wall biosynthesis